MAHTKETPNVLIGNFLRRFGQLPKCLHRLSLGNAKDSLKDFSWDKQGKKYVELYESLLA